MLQEYPTSPFSLQHTSNTMAKRKRRSAPKPAGDGPIAATAPAPAAPAAPASAAATAENTTPNTATPTSSPAIRLQIITGTYEKTLHGFLASIPPLAASPRPPCDSIPLTTVFTDTFLFSAHTSPLRTLTVSPALASTQKRILATASADERINLYTLAPRANRHLGTLHNHTNTPTALLFTPTRSKLISAGTDGAIHILRTRDWGVLSTLKVPAPKQRPPNFSKDYGDGDGPRIATFAGQGAAVNAIALHPSQKILLSVSAGERAVRMWNLMTGRRAGVLVFSRDEVPLKFGREGRGVEWASTGEEYAVAFDRGAVVFGMDSKAKTRIDVGSKVTRMRYVPRVLGREEVLAVGTEDGRVLFYASTKDVDRPERLGTLGGRQMGMVGRVKDFCVEQVQGRTLLVTAGSDGAVRVFDVCGSGSGIEAAEAEKEEEEDGEEEEGGRSNKRVKVEEEGDKQVGVLVGVYETARRITCMASMVMEEGVGEDEDVEGAADEESKEDSGDDGDDDDDDDDDGDDEGE